MKNWNLIKWALPALAATLFSMGAMALETSAPVVSSQLQKVTATIKAIDVPSRTSRASHEANHTSFDSHPARVCPSALRPRHLNRPKHGMMPASPPGASRLRNRPACA